MDTTSEYIKQCEKAGEIQKGWKPAECDYAAWHCEDRLIIDHVIDYDAFGILSQKGKTWLPRQDQLQEMWAYHIYSKERANNWVTFAIEQFSFWVLNEDVGFSSLDASMEQLWLAFVMKEKYKKT